MELCGPAIALVVSVQGIVEVRLQEKLAAGAAERQSLVWGCCPCPPAQPGRTAAQQQSVLRLDQKTTLAGPTQDNKTVLKMITGAIHADQDAQAFQDKYPFRMQASKELNFD